MTEADWLECSDAGTITAEFLVYPDRKLHFLAAAFLRRVWDRIPCDLTRYAVEATEAFADGRITADALAWVRSQCARETGGELWLGSESWRDHVLLNPDGCPCCEEAGAGYARRVAKQGGILDGVRSGLRSPADVVADAAVYARHLVEPVAPVRRRTDPHPPPSDEQRRQFAVVADVLGDPAAPARFNPVWRTSTVLALARGIHQNLAFDRLPILADAMEEAGCDDESVLEHCRRATTHVRGCWVVDLAMGFG
jgi:hypothetical protein